MATYLATWGAPGPRVFTAVVIQPAAPVLVAQPGPVDSQRIADTAFRRKKKRRIEAITASSQAGLVHSQRIDVTAAITEKPRDFKSLFELSGKSVYAFRAEIDQEIAQLLAAQQESDDEEAITLILAALED